MILLFDEKNVVIEELMRNFVFWICVTKVLHFIEVRMIVLFLFSYVREVSATERFWLI